MLPQRVRSAAAVPPADVSIASIMPLSHLINTPLTPHSRPIHAPFPRVITPRASPRGSPRPIPPSSRFSRTAHVHAAIGLPGGHIRRCRRAPGLARGKGSGLQLFKDWLGYDLVDVAARRARSFSFSPKRHDGPRGKSTSVRSQSQIHVDGSRIESGSPR